MILEPNCMHKVTLPALEHNEAMQQREMYARKSIICGKVVCFNDFT